MKLTERLNVLIQATTLSQKSGAFNLDEAVKAKNAIDTLSYGNLNQNFVDSINILIELAVSSQKKGVYTLKDAHVLYIAIENIEVEFQNEVNRINGVQVKNESQDPQETNNSSTTISIPPVKTKRKS